MVVQYVQPHSKTIFVGWQIFLILKSKLLYKPSQIIFHNFSQSGTLSWVVPGSVSILEMCYKMQKETKTKLNSFSLLSCGQILSKCNPL